MIQNSHGHECSTMAPPTKGPRMLPMAQLREIRPNHFPRSRRLTRSVVMTYVRARIPPEPKPWSVRPTRRVAMFFATAATMLPTVKMVKEASSAG